MLAASSTEREREDNEVRRKEREFFEMLSRPIQELDGLALVMEDHKKNKLLEEEAEANMVMQQTLDEYEGATYLADNTNDGDSDIDVDMTRKDTSPPKQKSRARKQQHSEQDEPMDPNHRNELPEVTTGTKLTPKRNKRPRSK